MRQRCYNKSNTHYSYYGERGITVCDEWQNYEAYRDWALANGYKDGLTIDRIDVDGNYCPENCRWVTSYVQSNNKRNNVHLTFKGETHTLREWAAMLNIDYNILYRRIYDGWSTEKALTVPPKVVERDG